MTHQGTIWHIAFNKAFPPSKSIGTVSAVPTHKGWTTRKAEEARINTFEMKCLGQIFRVSWTAKGTNEWVLETARVDRSLLATVKPRKLSHFGHILVIGKKKK